MTAAAFEQITLEVDQGVATLTLHRPDKLNAFTTQMMREMVAAFDAIDADDAIRAVIITGSGRAFCAGADISGGAANFRVDASATSAPDYSDPATRDGGGILALRIFQLKKPIIAAINGPAIGIGATMLLPMDLRIASDTARFGFVFARRGIVPEAASSYFLPRLVGISRALRWCYTGAVFGAGEALAGGLVEQVVPPSDLLPTAQALAREIADNAAPVSVALTRQMLWRGLGMNDPMEAHRIESRGILTRSQSADAQEGVAAFLEKRPARFPDRVSADMPDYFPWWEEMPYG